MIYGFGINDTGEPVHTVIDNKKVLCPYYERWRGMIRRCYSESFKKNPQHRSYEGCSVSAEWAKLSEFKRWMQGQNWEGMHLDKDLLGCGKVYSPSNCTFIDPSVNSFITDRRNFRGSELVGVDKLPSGRFRSKICSLAEGKVLTLGTFDSEEEAFNCWLENKYKQAEFLVGRQGQEFLKDYLTRTYSKQKLI